ncbi:MAG TPA: hypothetical protein G4O08_06905 [Anaerolineae bacterium]|nr:hypothetical protein [Anaerolineae bacterium]
MTHNKAQPDLEPRCRATTIGSLPHVDVARGTELMLESTPALPSWVQFPKRNMYENMMVQFTEGLPSLVEKGDRMAFDTSMPTFIEEITAFYENYLAAMEGGIKQALDYFAISEQYGAGFRELLSRLSEHVQTHDVWLLKGQVTGPFTLGTNLLDQEKQCSYYDETLHDIVVKSVELKAAWQMDQWQDFNLPMMIFIDEPALLGFGSQTFITVSREDVIADINAVTNTIHARGGLAGVHCEENTDWSLLMETELDVLDFDAYDHMQAISLYPAELHAFLDRGGWLGWGIVPTLDRDAAASETLESLLARFDRGMELLKSKGFDSDLLKRRALITPSCGAGGVLTEPLAERVLKLLREFSWMLRDRYGFSG